MDMSQFKKDLFFVSISKRKLLIQSFEVQSETEQKTSFRRYFDIPEDFKWNSITGVITKEGILIITLTQVDKNKLQKSLLKEITCEEELSEEDLQKYITYDSENEPENKIETTDETVPELEPTDIPITQRGDFMDDPYFKKYRNVINKQISLTLKNNDIITADEENPWSAYKKAIKSGSLKERLNFSLKNMENFMVILIF